MTNNKFLLLRHDSVALLSGPYFDYRYEYYTRQGYKVLEYHNDETERIYAKIFEIYSPAELFRMGLFDLKMMEEDRFYRG